MQTTRTHHLVAAALVLAVACRSTLTGNEGNFQFAYDADDWITDFNKPIAPGAFLDIQVREVGSLLPVELTAASYDDESVLSVVSFDSDWITVQGMGDGTALLSVEGTTGAGETKTDSINMLSSTPEVLVLWHSCVAGSEAYYLADQRVWVPFEMQMENSQPVIGYGYYPLALDTEAAALDEDDSNQQWMAFDTAAAAGTLVLSSEIDDTELTMYVAEEGEIDGVQEPIAWVFEDIDVGDTNAFFVRPMVDDLPICQGDLEKTVVSDTPDTCTVTDTDPVDATGDGEHEYGWFEVTGVAEGECLYTVSYPNANEGAGASEQFSYTIEP